MKMKSGRQLILAIALMTSLALCVSKTANAQIEPVLTSDVAMNLLGQDVGKWSGMRKDYLSGLETSEAKVVVVNRLEAGKWLYFQVAETVGSEVNMSKGTLEFDADSGTFVRRWFENGTPQIKRAKVTFEAKDKKLWYSMVMGDSRPGPDDAESKNKYSRVTVVMSSRDDDTRVVKTYSQTDLTDLSEGTLSSELVLTRVKSGNNKSKAGSKSATNSKVAAKAAPKKADSVTHVLRVTVFVGSVRLQRGQEPELTISPDEGIKVQRTSGDTFEFTGLKPGESYTVAGNYKLTSGFNFETQGKTSLWKTPTNVRKTTATKVLKLEQ